MPTLEEIRFASAAGILLAGVLHHPGETNPPDAVVVAHGMFSSKESDKHRSICEAAANRGMLALRFDFRGRGESDGDPAVLTVSNEIEDISAAFDHVRDCGARRLIAVGSSLGGTVALLAGAAETELSGLVTIAAPARLPVAPRQTWRGSGTTTRDQKIEVAPGQFIDAEFFRDATRHDPVSAARKVNCPWLIIHGSGDPVVPVEDAVLLAENVHSAELVTHPTAGHRFDLPEERSWLIETVDDFIASLR